MYSHKSLTLTIIIVSLLVCLSPAAAQQKSNLQQRAETEAANGKDVSARSLWIRAYEDYVAKGQTAQGVECGVKAAALYYKENSYQEAFDLLRLIDQSIAADKRAKSTDIAAWRYQVIKERMAMYIKMRRSDKAKEQIDNMQLQAYASGNESIKNDLLQNKAIFYYTFGQDAKGNAVFKEMADKLTAEKEYDKVDDVYRTLITRSLASGNANMVAQAYSGYVVWKDSVNNLKIADINATLKQQIAEGEAAMAEKDDTIASRGRTIASLCTLAAVLAVALVVAILLLMRLIYVSQRQRKTIRRANDNNALKAQFISNISSQMAPTLQKLDARQPEVKALQDFTRQLQTLSRLENTQQESVPLEEISLPPFCEELMNSIRQTVSSGIALTVNAPNMSAWINKDYVGHILSHLLCNAATHTPEAGHIWLEYKRRSAHKHQFLVANTGQPIPEEQREEVFRPFREIKDLTTGTGLGLPICRQMAVNMKGDLEIDPEFTKGTRFILTLTF